MNRFALPAVIIIALVARALLFTPAGSPDSERFLTQARHLVAGHGYLSPAGELETGLPPGYPLFLAALLRLDGLALIRGVQLGLSALTAALMWAALRPAGARLALAGGLALALHPWAATAGGAILSETLGAFLCGVLVYLLSKLEMGPGNGFAFGAVSVALLMVSPAAMFLALAIFLRALWLCRRSRAAILTMVVGALVLMIPWQVHVIAARRTIAPTVFIWDFQHDHGKWTRTWLRRERELWFRWHPRDLEKAPPRAFRSPGERELLVGLARNGTDAALAAGLRATGERVAAQNPLRFHVFLPAVRSAMLWLDMPQLRHVQMEYVARSGVNDWRQLGARRALLRLGKAVLSTLAWLVYVALPLATIAVGIRRRRTAQVLILVAIAVYTLITGYVGEVEARRNLVFYPALLFIPFYPRRQE